MKFHGKLHGLTLAVAITAGWMLACYPPGAVNNGEQPVQQPAGSNSATFTARQTNEFLDRLEVCQGSSLHDVVETWTPGQRVIREAGRQLMSSLRHDLRSEPQLHTGDYFIQYFGIVKQGRKLVFINGFHRAVVQASAIDSGGWRHAPVIVCDSGRGAFQTEYDVETSRLNALRFFSSYGGSAPP